MGQKEQQETTWGYEVSAGSGIRARPDWLQVLPLLLPDRVPQFLPVEGASRCPPFKEMWGLNEIDRVGMESLWRAA